MLLTHSLPLFFNFIEIIIIPIHIQLSKFSVVGIRIRISMLSLSLLNEPHTYLLSFSLFLIFEARLCRAVIWINYFEPTIDFHFDSRVCYEVDS